MTSTLIQYSTDAGVAVLELSNPPANAYSYEMFGQLDDALLRARMDDDVHVLVLRGAGDKFFCAGADIAMLDSVTPSFKYYFCLHANETLLRLENTPKLVIAAMNGHCVGGGLEVAMAADLRYGKAGGGKVGLPEVALGVLPGTGGTQRLARLLGKARAIELVNELLPADGFMGRVMEIARSFCPPGKASRAVGAIKRSVQTGRDLGLEAGLALERELQQQLFQSEDAREGLRAYVEGRTPRFSGK